MQTTCSGNKKQPSLEECVERLETLFKAYQHDSEFNYQLVVSDSSWSILKRYMTYYRKILKIIKKKKVEVGELYEGCNDVSDYNKGICLTYPQASDWANYMLTETEFNSIKEWLER